MAEGLRGSVAEWMSDSVDERLGGLSGWWLCAMECCGTEWLRGSVVLCHGLLWHMCGSVGALIANTVCRWILIRLTACPDIVNFFITHFNRITCLFLH